MAKKTIITDDFDGSTPAETYYFICGGKQYGVDLSEEHAKELQDTLKRHEEELSKYVNADRAIGSISTQSSQPARRRSTANPDTAKIREWAQANGYEVADRGRIAQEIREAYRNRSKKS